MHLDDTQPRHPAARTRKPWLLMLALPAAAASALTWWSTTDPRVAPPTFSITGPAAVPGARQQGPLRYLAIGGGSEPSLTQVSLEQDLALATRLLPGPGHLLFAGGADHLGVQQLSTKPVPDTLRLALGQLFAPRSDRNTSYRKPLIEAGAADAPRVWQALETALGATAAAPGSEQPLLLYVAAHGEPGETPRDNWVTLWGGSALRVSALAALHDARPSRPLRAVVASCFSGGFAELAFHDADSTQGISQAPRCGLFAGTWDLETSGCDPNPDRRAQEGYSLHFLHALAGLDRDGVALRAEAIDFDGDGQVSLLEAHTRARIAGRSIDVPTTTSERYLRAVVAQPPATTRGWAAMTELPEEQAVVTQLGHALQLADPAALAQAREQLERETAALDEALGEVEGELADAHGALVISLLERWPMLDDPWHPQFEHTLASGRAAISERLHHSPEAAAFQRALRALAPIEQAFLELQVQRSLMLRLARAYETLTLAETLRDAGGRAWQDYQALLTCERGRP